MRAFLMGAMVAAGLAGWLWLAWPITLGGQTSYLSTYGDSMEPQFRAGDLGVLRPADSYDVGDIVAYQSDLLQTTVMHRIVAIDNGRYTFQGDNNSWLDPEKPTRNQLIGKLTLQVPQGGLWLEHLASPPVLGLIAFALIASSGTAVTTRRRRRRRKEAAMSRHTSSTERRAPVPAVSSLPPTLQTAAAATALIGILGAGLGFLAWSGPLDMPSTAEVKSGTRMVFSYTADVGRSPAYDGTTATSPDPIFRKLANTVDVNYEYSGNPGSVTVVAELSTPDGWHSTVPLAADRAFSDSSHKGTVRLDLEALEAKARAASAATGMPASAVSIAVVPQVRTADGAEFGPALKLNLTPLQLTLPEGEQGLTVTDTSTVQETAVVPRTLGVGGLQISAATARLLSAVLLIAVLVTAVGIVAFARRSAPADEAAAIRRRYGALLVRVHPMPAPQGRPVIDVTSFATLAKLAERYGLLVLHWTRSNVETFVVQDESTTYRYRAGINAPAPDADRVDRLLDSEAVPKPSGQSET